MVLADHMRKSKGKGGGGGVWTQSPGNHKAIRFLSKSGPDLLKNHKAS